MALHDSVLTHQRGARAITLARIDWAEKYAAARLFYSPALARELAAAPLTAEAARRLGKQIGLLQGEAQ